MTLIFNSVIMFLKTRVFYMLFLEVLIMVTIKVFNISQTRFEQRQFLDNELSKKVFNYLSKSYSKEFVALSYSCDSPVAVDIETKRVLSIIQQTVLLEFMFYKPEKLSTNIASSNFILKYWTIKEVYSKFFKMGLYMDFKKINIKTCENGIYIVNFNGVQEKKVCLLETADFF